MPKKGKKGHGKMKPKPKVDHPVELDPNAQVEEVIGADVDEVIIYSSSHMSYHRGLRNLLLKGLGHKFHVTFRTHGGRTWDGGVADAYRAAQGEGKSRQKLHVILLGDNDVRKGPKGDPGTEFNAVDPIIQKLGETVKQCAEFDRFKGDTVFVNGILPFPVLESEDAPRLIENFYFFTRNMSNLIEFHPSIHYIPMRERAIDFCRNEKIELDGLFKDDQVHLNGMGEKFLSEHLIIQINAFRCSKRFGWRFDCLRFYLEIVNLETEDELDRHNKISVDTNFSKVFHKLDFISNKDLACFEEN